MMRKMLAMAVAAVTLTAATTGMASAQVSVTVGGPRPYVYRTYVATARGLEPAMAYYALLDRTPKGRAEAASEPLWVRRHDEY